MTGETILDRFRVDGRVAIVTGASSGFGVAIAEAFAQAGASVALAARRVDRLDETRRLVEAAGARAIVVPTDVTDPDACQALVDATVRELGGVDILANNAGVGAAVPALRESPEAFRAVIDINLNGSYWMAQAAARAMQPGSAIVNVSSLAAMITMGLPQAAYSASKGAILSLTRDLAQQWTGRRGIRVNAVIPGIFETEMTADFFESKIDDHLPRIPLGRGGRPDELAAVVLFLASEAASYLTGEAIVVDGGRRIY
jgi:NAD(P)-dependent dehydrogenase (short-subunit alcohol dehydrogenase family)